MNGFAFALAVALVVASGSALLFTPAAAPVLRVAVVVVFLVSAAIVGTVLLRMATGGDGVRDWISGGIAQVVRDDSHQLVWSDWALGVTRSGSLHVKSARLRLEKRLFLGLLPYQTIERRLSPDDVVTTAHDVQHATWLGVMTVLDQDSVGTSSGFEHILELRQPGQAPLRLLDLSSRNLRDGSAELVNRLGRRIEAAIGARLERR